MQTFYWHGFNKYGRKLRGKIRAQTLASGKQLLRQQGITIKKIYLSRQYLTTLNKQKIKPLAITTVIRQLATMVNSGMPLVQVIAIIAQGQQNQTLVNLLNDIKQTIATGGSLTQALAQYPRHFTKLDRALIEVGEQSGTLTKILNAIADHREKMHRLKRDINKALLYPIVVVTIAIAITAGMLLFIVPQFANIYANFDAQLPLATTLIIKLANVIHSTWWLAGLALVIMISVIMAGYRYSSRWHYQLDVMQLKIPLFGKILRQAIIARLTRTLATTFAAGLPLTEAIMNVANTSNNQLYYRACQEIHTHIHQGQFLHVAVTSTHLFPEFVSQMIASGETAGTLELMLTKIADHYDDQVERIIANLSTLLEPMIMIILGILIGGIVIAMYLPIFKLGSVI